MADANSMTPLTIYAGRAGDRNARGMAGAIALGRALGEFIGQEGRSIGVSEPPIPGGWSVQLAAATSNLRLLSGAIGGILDAGARPLTTMGRCAASIATLPEVARRHSDAAIVWFDAHGDSNVPTEGSGSENSYLGGMVLTGAAGHWNTGLGSDLNLDQVVLVGSRDLDAREQALIERGEIKLVEIGPDMPARLREAVCGRDVYVHLDCDVLDAGIVPTEYQVSGGLSLSDLGEACAVLADGKVLGLEITEFEAEWPDGRPGETCGLIEALRPLLQKFQGV
jgi:arginase family enzyme